MAILGECADVANFAMMIADNAMRDELIPSESMTEAEQKFISGLDSEYPVSPKQLFWLRDIKDKYC